MQSFQKKLLAWFQKNQRPLPWRKTYEPYQVWISEIMLQQTQVKTVLPYFQRWMKALPTIESVAKASEDRVLKLWEGLGYYSRARNIQKAAKIIVKKSEGKFPPEHEAILSLPGIGKYTAGAIASIAFNQDYPVVDGNVIRVVSRLLNFKKNVRQPQHLKFIWKWAGELFPMGHARQYNQALMELGALICKPQAPLCHACPLKKHCSSYQKGNQNNLPYLGRRPVTESIQVALAVIRRGKKVFIQKRPSFGLMPGLWEFPGGKINAHEKPERAVVREIQEELGIRLKNIRPLTTIDHGYTRFKVRLYCFAADYDEGKLKLHSAIRGKWISAKTLSHYPFPAANKKLIRDFLN